MTQMEMLILLFGLIVIICTVFISLHLRPLNDNEVSTLANKKREKQIRKYFTFENREYSVDKDFKKRMNPNGKFYKIGENLFKFPSASAGLLKYKKHEWIIIGYEKNEIVEFMWANKGPTHSNVSFGISFNDIIETAQMEDISTVIVLHNHPNGNPNYVNCREPSNQDITSANELSDVLNENGINLVEFVCERGLHYEFYRSTSDSFLPLVNFIDDIQSVNNKSKSKNFDLHLERLF